jgi:Protein of unknown function (DUF4031)
MTGRCRRVKSRRCAWQDATVTVYVDDAHLPWRGRRWSHLVAEAAEELHQAAERLGLRREWAQDKGRVLHYDLPDELRERAIELGLAEAITWRELVDRRSEFVAAGRRRRE